MFNIFKKKTTIEESVQAFPTWERAIKVGLYKRLTDELVTKGLPEEISKVVAAQGINYITGEDWEANVKNASPEIKSVIEKHKAEVVSSVNSFLEKDKVSREIIVYFLRIKSVLMFVAKGTSGEKQKDIEMTDEELKLLNVARKDVEGANKMFGGHGSKWMENPMKERIEKILMHFGLEFPEEADPVKFDKMILDFHHAVFPKR